LNRARFALGLTLVFGLSLTACNPTTPTDTVIDGTNDPLPADQGTDFASGYTSSTEQAVSSISLDDVITASSVPKGSQRLTGKALPPGCRTFEAGSNDDGDNDGAPEEVTYRFNPSKCVLTIPNGTRTLAGTLQIENKEKEDKGGYREQFNITIIDSLNNRSVTVVESRKGRAKLSKEGKSFIKFVDLFVSRRVNQQPAFSYRNKITYTFSPSDNTERKVNQALPAGAISVIGQTDWLQGNRLTRSFLISSPTALTYDPVCAKQGQGIVGGSETLNQDGKVVKITHGACGVAPTVQFDPK
jgi:hypothetical protein